METRIQYEKLICRKTGIKARYISDRGAIRAEDTSPSNVDIWLC
jgi:hypothetical protein